MNGSGGTPPATRPSGDNDVEAAAAKPTPPTTTKTTTTPSLRLRRLFPKTNPVARHLYERRPNVVTQKTRKGEWRQLKSRWRWMHSFFFWAGPPSYLLARVWPMLFLNMGLAAIVAADHLLRATATRHDGLPNSILPNITDNVIVSLSPMVRFMLFAASMLLTLRLGRVYDRWWSVRQAFSGVGSVATSLSQRVSAWCDPSCPRQQRLAQDVRRWGVIWHYSILHVCQNASAIHPQGAKLLTPEEHAIYASARKGRQIAVDKLVDLLGEMDFEEKKFNALEQLMQRGIAAAGVCTGVRFQSLPYALTLVSTGFVELFLLTLVLLMVQQTGPDQPDRVQDTIFTVCVVWSLYAAICVCLLGADEVANQLEDPFPWLPLEDIVATTERDALRVPEELKALRRAEEARARREKESEKEEAGL